MGTRSRIGYETENGAVYSIYCHWDGYPSHNGEILQNHYQDDEKIRALMELGNLSSLAESIDAPPGHSFDNRIEGHSVFYGRDRGETGQEHTTDDSRAAFFARARDGWEEYAYLRVAGEWWISGVGGGAGPMLVKASDPDGIMPAQWRLLCDVLAGEEEVI
jgi:hypothetical protein